MVLGLGDAGIRIRVKGLISLTTNAQWRWQETVNTRAARRCLGHSARPRVMYNLPLGELEPLAGALLTVLLAFTLARIAGQETGLLQGAAKLSVELNQSA